MRLIINHWLKQDPPALLKIHIAQAQYILFDGTYFHKNGCLVVFVDIAHKQLIYYAYIERENYRDVYPLLIYLKEQGLNPSVFTLDGHKMVTRAICDAWPGITIQRCLFHIQKQGTQWLRAYPKTQAGRDLKKLLKTLPYINSLEVKQFFLNHYISWHKQYADVIKALPRDSVANKDLKRTISLINNAIPDMFHYLDDNNIAPTTNYLEGIYSQLKHQYRCHRGLTENHKIQYLKWYCYLKNRAK